MEKKSVLKVQDLSVSFRSERGSQYAVEHVSFELCEGKTLAVVGESGSGKSVSSLSIMQLLQKEKAVFESGKLIFDADFFEIKTSEAPRILTPNDKLISTLRGKVIAMIFQEPMTALNPVITCGEQVSEMLRRHKKMNRTMAKKRVIELFSEVQLPRPEAMFDQYPHQLSGGQRQRVMIAMAVSCEPKVLIADEPTTALDVTVQKSILALLKNLQIKYKMAMLFITHDLGVVAEIADDIVVMRAGKIVEKGSASDILNNPKEPYTKGLLSCKPVLGQKVDRLKTVADFVSNTPAQTVTLDQSSKRIVSGELLLDVRNAFKTYIPHRGLFKKAGLPVKAVDDVSFHINTGETLGLVGESGCGKTTLSRMLLGLIPTTTGEIRFHLNGRQINVTNASSNELRTLRKDIQIIFQDPYSSLNPKQTIGSAITEPMEVFSLGGNKKGRINKAVELLEQVGLKAEHLARYPHEFSGGQRQRIVIARALAVEPKFIICDESVSALDVSVQAQVLNLLNDLKRMYGLTYLFISHDLGVVYHMSDRIMVMSKGSIAELGSAEDVFYRPQSDYTRRLIASIPGSEK